MSALLLLEARFEFERVARPSYQYCRENGIDWTATAMLTGGLYLSPIRFVPPRRFEFDERGVEAPVIEALDEIGRTVDLVAWPIAEPDNFATMFGATSVLGANIAADPSTFFGGRPLHLYRRPLDWLQSRCDGAVLLDMPRAARWLNDQPGRLAAEDGRHARMIRDAMLATVDISRIVIRPAQRKAA